MLKYDSSLTNAIWAQFQPQVVSALAADDDINLWSTAIGHIIADAEFLSVNAKTSRTVFTEIGRCSHWLRPHQTRWTADGGFAWPAGYGGAGYSRSGLPEFDWSLIWQWNADHHKWECTYKPTGKQPLRLRIAIPSRTREHNQAAVHTIWTPGCPTTPKQKLRQFYGFREVDGTWTVTAFQCSNDNAYNRQPSGASDAKQPI
jgi:hypothetical protein